MPRQGKIRHIGLSLDHLRENLAAAELELPTEALQTLETIATDARPLTDA